MSDAFDHDVFFSYSSTDKLVVHSLAERLKEDGLRVWLDDWIIQPGDMIGLKIEQGLERSRILVLVMSRAAFESAWSTLERHTPLFRDPTNKERRFIPLLIEDCIRPSVIAQFAYVDWRTPSNESYEKLLNACRQKEGTTSGFALKNKDSVVEGSSPFYPRGTIPLVGLQSDFVGLS